MAFDCESLKQLATTLSLVTHCDVIKNGMLRLATPFRYPEGSQIDVFLGDSVLLGSEFKLTDMGQTIAYLLDLQIKPWATQKRKQIVDEVCKAMGVHREEGEFFVTLTHNQLFTNDLPDSIARLSQVCIRVADLAYTQRLRTPTSFRDDVEEFITNDRIEVESGIVLPGRFNEDVTVDFRTKGKTSRSLILTMSTNNHAAAHGIGNEVFRKWYDLSPQQGEFQFVTIYDSTTNAFRDDDLARLNELSTVLAFPAQQETIVEALAA